MLDDTQPRLQPFNTLSDLLLLTVLDTEKKHFKQKGEREGHSKWFTTLKMCYSTSSTYLLSVAVEKNSFLALPKVILALAGVFAGGWVLWHSSGKRESRR